MKIYIKNSLFNIETAEKKYIIPAGNIIAVFSDTDTRVSFEGVSGIKIPSVNNVLITDIQKESGVSYVDKADFLTDLGSFFFNAPSTAEWGDITGTLSNQTDLQTALNTKQTADPAELDADTLTNTSVFTFWKSALKKITWDNIKATLKTYFDSLYRDISETYTTKAVFIPTAPISGILTYIDDNNFSVAGAIYTPDEFFGRVVEIKQNGQTQYCIIASNTADTIILAQPMLWSATTGDAFNILDTHYISLIKTNFPQIYGLYPTNFSGALVLPEITEDKERLVIDCYIESLESDNEIVIVAKGSDGFFSNQYRWVKLVDDKENFRLLGHFNTINLHWDIINIGNLKRYLTAYYSEFLLATNTDPQFIPSANFNIDKRRRFECREISGSQWCEYTSLIPKFFLASFTAEIQKIGGGGAGEVTIKWYKYISLTDTTVALPYESTTRFGTGDGVQTITLNQPVELSYGDRLAVTITREAGTITLQEFSNIYIKEF